MMVTAASQQLVLGGMPAGPPDGIGPAWTATVTGAPTPNLPDYDVVLVCLSGGADSQATAGVTSAAARAAGMTGQLVAVHCDLGGEEWPESPQYAALHASHFGIPRFEIVRREIADPTTGQRQPQGLLDHIAAHGKFPDAARRFCTSDMKTGPTRRLMTELVRELDPCRLGRPVRILNVQGHRAQESPRRRQLPSYSHDDAASNQTRRRVDTWYPIHAWTKQQVRASCDTSGVAHHPAYDDPPGSGNWAGMPRISCSFCLAGETEVVTRDGIRPIAELVGGRHRLLVPKVTAYGLSTHGAFAEVEVRCFGSQRLWRIDMHRGRQRKVVYATAEHRWLVVERKLRPAKAGGRHSGYEHVTAERTTAALANGDRLRSVRAQQPTKTKMVPSAVAQGFVYGDGGKGLGDWPATLTVDNAAEDGAILRFLAAHETRRVTANKNPATLIYGLPSLWKAPPDLRESRAFLRSWLAGYFAADGTVTTVGTARLACASVESMRAARTVAAICGIGYGPVRATTRLGKGSAPTPLYTCVIDTTYLPDWFFIIGEHRRRIAARADKREAHERSWLVDTATPTDRVEPVYCAVVPTAHAFALTEDLMTGNCVLAGRDALILAARRRPELAARYADVERRIGHRFKAGQSMAEIVLAAAAPTGPAAPIREWLG